MPDESGAVVPPPSEKEDLPEPPDPPERAIPAFSQEGIAFIQLLMKIERTEWAAPYPSPGTLAAFEQISPGLAADLVGMAMKQQEHDNAMERNALRWEGIRSVGALFSAFFIAALMIGVSGWLINGGHGIAGTLLGGGTIVSLVTVFLKRDRETEDQPPAPRVKRARK